MYNLILENEDGDQLTFNNVSGNFQIINIDGLYPPSAIINTNTTALIDGGTFNSSKVNMRTIKLAFTIEKDAELNRIAVYNVLRIKRTITLYYKSPLRDVFIDGYVEHLVVNHFGMKQTVTLTMLCPFPHFKKAQQIVNELSSIINMFHFPFASTETPEIVFGEIDVVNQEIVDNEGTVETGLIFELYAKAAITNPKIFNYQTQEYIGLNYSMQAGDLITINTGPGEKSVTLLREAVTSNIFNAIMKGSTWLQLPPGGAGFVYTIDAGIQTNLVITIEHYDLYEGV